MAILQLPTSKLRGQVKPLGEMDQPIRPENDQEMGFFEHIGELRRRVLRALYAIVPAIGIAWGYKEYLFEILLAPLVDAWHQLGLGKPKIHFANPIEPFVAYLKISIVAGILLAAPWIFWQVWGFISPGLYRREKLYAIPFVFFSTLFFTGGALFGYLVVFPMGFEVFLGFAEKLPSDTIDIQPTLMISEYLSFATRMLLAFGVVFEVPVVVTVLAAAGLVNWKQLLRFSRWWIVIAAVISALLTPPDVASQAFMLIPLVVLYFLSVGIAFIIGDRREKAAAAAAAEAGDD